MELRKTTGGALPHLNLADGTLLQDSVPTA